MPTLNWMGKEKVVNHHRDVPYRVLERVPEKGVLDSHGSDCGNMVIHGDNLEALKALLPEYEGKVDCVYIDPPYNTGNEGWVYNDNVNDPRIRKWLNQAVGKEGEDFCRHDKWLCMMYPRLQLHQHRRHGAREPEARLRRDLLPVVLRRGHIVAAKLLDAERLQGHPGRS
ncbi:hypothetical protein [Collinsella tanakaei]|uniref:hypothetical protein n=1 Tax=Collinsella tanakaei TaxID=626935 RepID=UPI00265CC2A7|nr:hypothetical protein [Collinsella tanakaei]